METEDGVHPSGRHTPMISDRLKPDPVLHRSPILPLGGAALAAALVLGAMAYAFGVTFLLALSVGLVVAIACATRFERSFALLFLLSLGVSYTYLLTLRPSAGSFTFPINPLDFAIGLLVVAFLLNMAGRRLDPSLPRPIRAPYLGFAAMTAFGLIYGLGANSGSLYTYFKDFRIFFVLHLCIVGAAWYFRRPERLRFLAVLFVLAGVSCAAQQVGRFVLAGAGGMAAVRDPSLTTQVIPMAAMFLAIYRYHGLRLIPRNTYPFLLFLLLFAVLISFTRTVWVMTILAYAVGLRYMGGRQRARAIFAVFGLFALFVFVVPFLFDLAAHGMNLREMIEFRFQAMMEGQRDFAAQHRIVTSGYAWLEFLKSPVWGLGIGYPIYVYDIQIKATTEDLGLHNSPLYYGIKIGSIGLAALVWMIVRALRRTIAAARPNGDRMTGRESVGAPSGIGDGDAARRNEVRVFAQALLAAMVPFLLIGPWSGNLNYFQFMPLLGLFLGLDWDRLAPQPSAAIPGTVTQTVGGEG